MIYQTCSDSTVRSGLDWSMTVARWPHAVSLYPDEDLNDHDELRHDPMLAVLSGKLAAGREDCGSAPAG